MIQGMDEIFEAFDRLRNVDYSGAPSEIKNQYVEQTYIVDAIDSGDFVQSIEYREANNFSQSVQKFEISTFGNTDVNYGDIIERGRKDRPNYPKRYPAKLGIENSDLDPFFTTTMDWVFNS